MRKFITLLLTATLLLIPISVQAGVTDYARDGIAIGLYENAQNNVLTGDTLNTVYSSLTALGQLGYITNYGQTFDFDMDGHTDVCCNNYTDIDNGGRSEFYKSPETNLSGTYKMTVPDDAKSKVSGWGYTPCDTILWDFEELVLTTSHTEIEKYENIIKEYQDEYFIDKEATTESAYNTYKSSHQCKENVSETFVKEVSRTLTKTQTVFTGVTIPDTSGMIVVGDPDDLIGGGAAVYNYVQREYYDVVQLYNRKHELTTVTTSEEDKIDQQVTTSTKEDVAGSSFGLLKAKQSKVGKNSITISWNRPQGAVKFVIYGNRCGVKNKYKNLTTVTGTSFTQTNLKKGTYYKYMVVAFDSNSKVIATSKSLHIATSGGKVGNIKKVSVKKTKVSLAKNKTFKLKGKQSGKKVKIHRGVKYETSNPQIATVGSKGVIKAKSKGVCYIYAYGQNGIHKKVKVTVK